MTTAFCLCLASILSPHLHESVRSPEPMNYLSHTLGTLLSSALTPACM